MINMVPNILEHKDHESFGLVVATPCLDLLSKTFHHFKLVVCYDPFEPADGDVHVHGVAGVERRELLRGQITQQRCGSDPQRVGIRSSRILSKSHP